jgi:DNA-binding transcriptional regulator LsrR (DeoR family)
MTLQETSEHAKTRIAWLYYMEGLTQDEIVAQTGLNRSKVLRILAASRQDGTVQIRVTTNLSKCVELERALEERWGFSRAIVIPEPLNQNQTNAILGAALGAYISQNVTSHMTIGLGWGRTLTSALPSIVSPRVEGIRVLSMLGGLTRVTKVNPSEFAWRVADRLNAECYQLTAPVFAPDPQTKEALLAHTGIKEIFMQARSLDMAIVSVGTLTPNSAFVEYGLLSKDEIASLHAAGAVGDVLCNFIDEHGAVIDHPVNDRVIAVKPDQLSAARNMVLVSGGWDKFRVVHAGIKLLRPKVLIVNERLAEQLSQLPK